MGHTILFLRTCIVDTFVFVESKMIISTFLVIFQIFEVISFPQSSERPTYPDHASCRIDWIVPASCDRVRIQIIDQMNQWKGDTNCGKVSDSCPTLKCTMPCGQNCLYEFLETYENGTIEADHLTPVKRYVDSLTFAFEELSAISCQVEGFSSSDLWYAYLDFGTNYCNLRNLLDGTELSSTKGFQEVTNDSICTQYTSRDCSRF